MIDEEAPFLYNEKGCISKSLNSYICENMHFSETEESEYEVSILWKGKHKSN